MILLSLLFSQALPAAACSQSSAAILHRDGAPARIALGFECDTTRERSRLVSWSLKDGERAWNTAADAETLAFARKLYTIPDLDGDDWQDLAVISLDARTQDRIIAIRSGARGETLRILRADPDERDYAAVVLPVSDRDGDGVGEIAVSVCVQDPAQRTYYAALVIHSGKTGARIDRIVSTQRANALQGTAVTDGARWVWLLAARSVQAFDLRSGVVARSWQAMDADPAPMRLVRSVDGALALLESLPGGALQIRELDTDSLAVKQRKPLEGVRPALDIARLSDRNGDGIEDWLVLHNGSADGLGTWLSGKDWSVLGSLRPEGVSSQFLTGEVQRVGDQGFVITNRNQRPQEKERGAYWFGVDGKLRRVFSGS